MVACREVERNAFAAGLVATADDWRCESLYNWNGGDGGVKLARWPLPRLPGWIKRVNEPVSENKRERLQRALAGSQPFGEPGWAETTPRKYNLKSTLVKRGRPPSPPKLPNRLLTHFLASTVVRSRHTLNF